MEPDKTEPPRAPEMRDRHPRKGLDSVNMAAAAMSVAWIAVVAALRFLAGPGAGGGAGGGPGGGSLAPVGLLADILSILLPLGLIWIAAVGIRTTRALRAQVQRLQESIDAMRHAHVMQQQTTPLRGTVGPTGGATVARRPDAPDRTARDTRADGQTPLGGDEGGAAADSPAARPALSTASRAGDDAQAALALDEPRDIRTPGKDGQDEDDDGPITIAEFIRAMNFPENEDDAEGFRTLRRALADQRMARMIRASQDVLTLLSQDGIYMDELRPDKPRAETWRRFARGERGPAVAGLGGIHDRACLSQVGERMKSDPVFRDAVLHFMRQFDKVLVEFEETATDRELIEMGETRTARAFMLLGRVAGSFD